MTTKAPGSRAAGSTPTVREVNDATERLRRASRELREALTHVRRDNDEAWEKYRADVGQSLAAMEMDLSVAKADLEAERAKSRAMLHDAVASATKAARGWLDDLAVQADLGRMEIRDRAAAVASALERVSGDMTHLVSTPLNSPADRSAFKDAALAAFRDIRRAGAQAARVLVDTHDQDRAATEREAGPAGQKKKAAKKTDASKKTKKAKKA